MGMFKMLQEAPGVSDYLKAFPVLAGLSEVSGVGLGKTEYRKRGMRGCRVAWQVVSEQSCL